MLAALALAAAGGCLLLGPRAERALGRRDPGEFVLDEAAGLLLALCGLPLAERPLAALAPAVLCFRAFDVAKPWPAGALQRLPGGLGILLDDVAAGAYAHLAARVALLAL